MGQLLRLGQQTATDASDLKGRISGDTEEGFQMWGWTVQGDASIHYTLELEFPCCREDGAALPGAGRVRVLVAVAVEV